MIVVSGASGNTGRRITQALLAAGKQVKAISRKAENVADLAAAGAHIAEGDLEDTAFLTGAITGAEVVYVLIPPNFATPDFRAYQREVAQSWIAALQSSGVRKIVLLSSQGSHRADAGVVSGLHEFEQQLSQVAGLEVLALRPGYFFQNMYANLGMIKHMGILGSALRPDAKVSMVHTDDIADAAVPYLLEPGKISGFTRIFVPGPADLTMAEVAQIIGKAIGKDLPYVPFSYTDSQAGMVQAGLQPKMAEAYNELYRCINEGHYADDFDRHASHYGGKSLEEFANAELKGAYQAA